MKSSSKLTLSLSILCMIICLQAQGQTYYNYIFGYTSPTPNPSHSIVRTVDAQRAVAYYEEGNTHKLAVIDMYGHIAEVTLRDVEIKDIRIVGDDIFFCGQKTSALRGIVGHTSVSAIESCSVGSINYEVIDMGIYPNGSTLWRMAAYVDGLGVQKVVAVGEMYYTSTTAPLPPCIVPCTSAYYGACRAYFAIEFNYVGGQFIPIGCKFSMCNNHFESVDDVVVTDNWLAIVSSHPDGKELIIHKCNKNNVLATFDSYYSYTIPFAERVYHCCKMKGDTIAMVALYSPEMSPNYETHMRTVDLASMTMTSAQGYSLLEKAEPEEIVYLPEYATLVLLQHQQFPMTGFHYAFVYWKPYIAPPYNATVIYDNHDHPFHSIDRLTNKDIVAAGGNYWIEMDVPNYSPASTCYTIAHQQIFQLGMPAAVPDNWLYCSLIPQLLSNTIIPNCVQHSINMGCRFN